MSTAVSAPDLSAAATPSPFHEGERQVQARLGVARDIEPWARRVVRPFMPEEHRAFHAALPFLVAAARDARGRPWATLLTGPEGFVTSPDPRHLHIAARPLPGDALTGALACGSQLGLLGIELHTRRRNRVNGRLATGGDGALVLQVQQSFGNCPQYVHERRWRRVPATGTAPRARRGTRLTARQQAWIRTADTFFIASGHRGADGDPAAGMDASHRGGDAGFVKVESATRLVLPDYAGNNHFNTLGNLVTDPRAGLLFVDFASGALLQLTGRTRIDWGSGALRAHPGARRLVILDLDEAVQLDGALPLRFDGDAGAVRSLRVIEKVPESADVTSFVLAARDGGELARFEAGQHLSVELRIPGQRQPVKRSYSLSGAPAAARYRISVKREERGLASRHLHDAVRVGDVIDARAPGGDFVLVPGSRPVVLLSAGVGVTPLLSMLHALAAPGEPRRVWFVHAARDGAHHPLAAEARALAARGERITLHVSYSRPRAGDARGTDHDAAGRLDPGRVAALLPDLDAEFYLCGPPGFMAAHAAGLEALGVPAPRIHAETFGPGVSPWAR